MLPGQFLARQLLKPSTVYSGQKLNRPVAKGTTPTQPQGPMAPARVAPICAAPATMRRMRSMPPELIVARCGWPVGDRGHKASSAGALTWPWAVSAVGRTDLGQAHTLPQYL